MWVFSLIASLALHVTVMVTVGVKSGTSESFSGKPFSIVDLDLFIPSVPPQVIAAKAGEHVDGATVVPVAKRSNDDAVAESPAKPSAVSFEKTSPPFYKTSEVSHIAQLQLPLEGVLFSDELSLSGRLVLDIAVSDQGKVVNIEVISASDPSGALRARMLPMLREAPFTPAYKDGRPVNSIRRVEFTLGVVLEDPTLGYKSSIPPGFRPNMDERGNILKVQPYQ